MKKVLLMLLAGVSMVLAFTSCEDENDPNNYCWEGKYTYTDIQGLKQEGDTDMAMTIAQKNDLLDKGVIDILGFRAEVKSIKKQSNDECEIDFGRF